MFKCVIPNLTENRQKENIQKCEDGKFQIKGSYNPHALERVCSHMEMTPSEIIKNKRLLRLAALACSIDASRQGGFDEDHIISGINDQFSNINLENLSATAFRPMDDGNVFTNKQMKEAGRSKTDGLKSFDFRISGKIKGFGMAKIKKGAGGHQDNVEREIIEYIKWFNKFGKEDNIYIVLIDGNHDYDKLRKLCKKDNIFVVDHEECQEILNNYE